MKPENKKIKQALDTNVPEWDDAFVWEQIENTLPTEKKRRPFFWWFSGLGIFIIGALLFLNTKAKTESYQGIKVDDDLISENTKIESKDEKNQTFAKAIENKTEKSNTDNQPLSVAKEIELETQPSKSIQLADQKSKGQSNNRSGKQFSGVSDEQKDINQVAQSIAISTPIPPVSKKSEGHNDAIAQNLNANPSHANLSQIKLLDPCQIQLAEVPSFVFAGIDSSQLKLDDLQPKMVPASTTRNALVTQLGVYVTQRSFTASESSDWLLAKDNSEEVLETVDFNVQHQWTLGEHWSAGVGLGYSQINERVTWRDTILTFDETTFTSNIKTVTQSFDVLKVVTPNAYKSIYLPLSIAYFSQRAEWSYFASLRGDISLLNAFKGRYLSFDLRLINSEDNENFPINKSVGLQNITASVGCAYEFKPGISLSLGVSSRYGLQNRLSSSSHQLKYNGLGLQVGLRYTFSMKK